MKTILYITNQICGSGGLERVLSIKASYLADHYGYKVHILTLNQGDEALFYDFSTKLRYHDIAVAGNPIKYLSTYKKKINAIVEEVNPDVILVCDDGLKGFFLPLLIKNPCPKVYERHVSKNVALQSESASFIKKLSVKLKNTLMNSLAKRFDKFVVLTNGNINDWNLKNLEVIPNPLSFYPEKNISNLSNKKVLAVGKQCYQKGYDRLLKSWEIVNKTYPDWQLDIYGKIEPSEKLEELADSLKISESVSFFPPTKTIEKQYQEASVYVMPSRYEGFGMVLIEAMAYGVPCVSFDCPFGPSDIISDNKNGILVENGDIKGLAKGIESLINDSDKRKKMGENARKDIEKYLPEKIAKQWDELFTNLIKNK